MHVETIVQQLLSNSIHKTRIKGLIPVLQALIKSKKLNLTQLGRSLCSKAKERSGIRLIDRLLANTFYQNHAIKIYQPICLRVIGNKKNPDIIVDWSSLPNSQYATEGGEHCILRATYASAGRGITIYEEVHPKVHKEFLYNLKSILPDAGFKNPWFLFDSKNKFFYDKCIHL